MSMIAEGDAPGSELSDVLAALEQQLPVAVGLLAELQARTADTEGVTRASYGTGEQVGHDLMRAVAEDAGLEVATDAAGNLYATLRGLDRQAPRWISGSHFDSVPKGGNYDGAAGAAAALAAVLALKGAGIRPRHDMTAMAIRAEECSSWFTGHHGGHLGSRAALGLLQPSELKTAIHVSNGRTLGECLAEGGFDAAAVAKGPPPLSSGTVRGFIELHIEQGPVLVRDRVSAGIVTSIRGTVRAREARCMGVYSHSGAVPQELRQDAVLATAELIHRVERRCDEVRAAGADVVFAVGRLHTDAAADSLSKVPGEVRFTIDLRSQDAAVLARLNGLLDELAGEIGARRNVRFELGRRALAEPTIMDPAARAILRETAATLGIAAPELPCGAGHDAAEFVRAGIPSCMVFVRNSGESHNPDEHMDAGDFRDGVRLVTSFLARMAAV
jgi:N-carbamoyl-L-amino-acid hydrolase